MRAARPWLASRCLSGKAASSALLLRSLASPAPQSLVLPRYFDCRCSCGTAGVVDNATELILANYPIANYPLDNNWSRGSDILTHMFFGEYYSSGTNT